MADCDLCGVARPTLCPVKVEVPRFKNAFPKGMWMGICEECSRASHDANAHRSKANGKKCDLCGKKSVDLFATAIRIPDFSEPYYKAAEKKLCNECLQAAEDAYNKRQAELAAHAAHSAHSAHH